MGLNGSERSFRVNTHRVSVNAPVLDRPLADLPADVQSQQPLFREAARDGKLMFLDGVRKEPPNTQWSVEASAAGNLLVRSMPDVGEPSLSGGGEIVAALKLPPDTMGDGNNRISESLVRVMIWRNGAVSELPLPATDVDVAELPCRKPAVGSSSSRRS
jgi:hypothetical protein